MKFGDMLANPSLGGKVLLGGGALQEKWGRLSNLQKALVIGVPLVIILIIVVMAKRKEGMVSGTTFFGLGPSASHIPGYGTYGYAQALTYNTEREPVEVAEGQLVNAAQKMALARANTEDMADAVILSEQMAGVDPLVKENMAGIAMDLPVIKRDYGALNKGQVQDTVGFAKPYPRDNMANVMDAALKEGGVSQVMMQAYRGPAATGMGATTFAMRQAEKALKTPVSPEHMGNYVVSPFTSGHNQGAIVADPTEGFHTKLLPRRNSYERFTEGMAQVPGSALAPRAPSIQDLSPNIGAGNAAPFGFKYFPDSELSGKYITQNEPFGLNLHHKKKGGEITGFTGHNNGHDSNVANNIPYSSDRAQFLTLVKEARGAKVYESDCDQYGRCKINFEYDPQGFALQLVNLVNQLSKSERDELMALSQRYTVYQLDAPNRIRALDRKKLMAQNNKSIQWTGRDQDEMSKLTNLMKNDGKNIMRYNDLVERAALKLSSKQFIVPAQTPGNACKVQPGLRYYGPGGKLQRLDRYIPANSCDYDDLVNITPAAQQLGGMTKPELQKVANALSNTVQK